MKPLLAYPMETAPALASDLASDPTVTFTGGLLVVGILAFLLTLLLAKGVQQALWKRKPEKPAARRPTSPEFGAPEEEPLEFGRSPAAATPGGPSPALAVPEEALTRAPFHPGGSQAAVLRADAPLPRPAMPVEETPDPLVAETNQDEWPSSEEWNRLFRAVMRQDSILRERGRGLSRRRSLQSLIAQLRDRDLLYEKGRKMGQSFHSASYAELAEKLSRNGLCTDAKFGRPAAGGDGLEITLVGTAMSRGVPKIGASICYLEAGFLSGALSNLERQDLQVHETLCVAKGDPYCAFRAHAREAPPDGDAAAAPAFDPPPSAAPAGLPR